jgi:hypothetical protein
MFDAVMPLLRATAMMFLVSSFTYGCAPLSLPQRPPKNYQGPVAERPFLQPEDNWIYGRPDGSRIKLAVGTLLSQIDFPLWVGKVWNQLLYATAFYSKNVNQTGKKGTFHERFGRPGNSLSKGRCDPAIESTSG